MANRHRRSSCPPEIYPLKAMRCAPLPGRTLQGRKANPPVRLPYLRRNQWCSRSNFPIVKAAPAPKALSAHAAPPLVPKALTASLVPNAAPLSPPPPPFLGRSATSALTPLLAKALTAGPSPSPLLLYGRLASHQRNTSYSSYQRHRHPKKCSRNLNLKHHQPQHQHQRQYQLFQHYQHQRQCQLRQ